MNKTYSVQDLVDVANKGLKPPACDETLKVAVNSAESGVAKGVWRIDETFLNGHRVVMGGFVTAAADIMMAYAIASVLQPHQGFSSINLNTTYHRPTFDGEVMIEAKVERQGKTIAYLTADLYQKEKKVASATSSMLIFDMKINL